MAECSHLDQIEIFDLPEGIEGCESWSWCFEDQIAFLVTAE